MTTTIWHHDVSYERQPPGYIMLGILACPYVGGDTVVADTTVAYKRLSANFRGMLDGLKVVHTSANMLAHAKASKGMTRADLIDSVHPLIRVHPVTGERSIFLNREFPREILGLKDLEAELVVFLLLWCLEIEGRVDCEGVLRMLFVAAGVIGFRGGVELTYQ